MTQQGARVVSSESEQLILVDENDRQIGTSSKAACHDGEGVLHRAFSVFLFNADGDLLLQQRAPGKRLWPGYWSNSCCSHPRVGETLDIAVARRLDDELHTAAELEFVYRFQYQASFGELGAEHELCHVFLGRVTGEPRANASEIAAMRYIPADELDRELDDRPDAFTPWFKLEWRKLGDEYAELLAGYTDGAGD